MSPVDRTTAALDEHILLDQAILCFKNITQVIEAMVDYLVSSLNILWNCRIYTLTFTVTDLIVVSRGIAVDVALLDARC